MNRLKLSLLSLAVIGSSTLSILFGLSDTPLPKFNEPAPTVLGRSSTSTPTIYISSARDGYNTGGVLSQSILDEPAIQMYSFDDSGQATIDIYQANMDQILTYLMHNEENKQTTTIDFSNLTKVNTLTTGLTGKQDNRILLPISGEGIWLLKVKFQNSENFAYLIRTSIAGVAKEGNNLMLVWVQDLVTKKTIPAAEMTTYSLQKEIKALGKIKADPTGIMKVNFTQVIFDVAVLKSGDHQALLPINMHYLNGGGGYQSFVQKTKNSRYFLFTDRPLYKPEDTVYFKAIIRDDDDVKYKIPAGSAVVKAYKDGDEKAAFYEQSYPISASGTITGQLIIPASQGTGNFQISVKIPNTDTIYDSDSSSWSQTTAGFQVEHFRKPDYFLDITSDYQIYITGGNIQANVSGQYFSGQPLTNREVKYRVYSSSYYEYEFLTDKAQFFDSADYNYGYWNGKKVYESTALLDSTGLARIDIPTADPMYKSSRSQVITVEAEFTDESGNPVNARKNFLVYPGEFSVFRHSEFYTGQVGRPYNLPILIKSHTTAGIKDVRLTAKITRDSWIAQPLAAGQKYPNYIKETQELSTLSATTDQLGKAVFTFTPTQTGSYHFVIEATDNRGYVISKDMYAWISNIDRPAPSGQYYQEVKIEADKQLYEPTDKINLKIWSDTPDRDYLLTFERDRVNRSKVISVSGQTAIVNLDIEPSDVPNIYVTVSGFNDNSFISDTANLSVSPQSKHLKVVAAPESTRYGPGQTAIVNIQTLDSVGQPVQADVAFWAVDKAIFELSESTLGNIFNRFWSNRYNYTASSHSLQNILVNSAEMGGCFTSGTQILMANGQIKPIEQVKSGDYVLTRVDPNNKSLTKAKVLSTHKTTEDGYLIVNSTLRITPNHILFVNGSWKTAGEISLGDTLSDKDGNPVIVTSLEWQAGASTVYNLEVEKYHTFIADNYWVHNQKGGGGGRSVFKDTAYWNPSIKTDSNGRARVVFKLPDNLTTWTLAAVAATPTTQVGQTTTEIVVSKEVFIRPVLPNFFRVGDTAKVSALIYNYSDVSQDFEAKLDFDSGKITSPAVQDSLVVSPNNFRQIFWDISVEKPNSAAGLTMSIKSKLGKTDSVSTTLPSLTFGFSDLQAKVGTGNQTFTIDIPSDTKLDESSVTVSLASNLLGTLPTAMKYLIQYPYGCIEQTTSSLVPALVTKANLDLYYDALQTSDLDKIISKGIARLVSLQSPDGGWGWWYEKQSNLYITDYVLENLLLAKKTGADIPDSLIDSAVNYLKNVAPKDPAQAVYRLYGLSLVDTPNLDKVINVDSLSVVPLAYAVLVNSKSDTNPQSNGLAKLISLAIPSGDALYWPADSDTLYPSVEYSTALAIRAILAGGGDRELAVKGARHLLSARNKNYWANTHATAQVISSITNLYKTGSDANPDYTYSVDVNNKTVSTGKVSSSTQIIKDILLPVSVLQTGSNKIVISKEGTGEIYSTIVGNYWRTDQAALPVSNTISLTKKITNNKGPDYTIGVGDVVTVTLTVSNLPPNSQYLVVEDQLPSGFVPVNTNLNNETKDRRDYTNREFTRTGVVLSSFAASDTYTYEARAVSEGTFLTPPATASLMYQPEVSARSDSQTITIEKASEVSLAKQIENTLANPKAVLANYKLLIGAVVGLLVTGTIVFFMIKFINRRRSHA